MPRRQFAGYELLGKLATGGMAELYLARRVGGMRFEKLVALKRLQKALATDPSYVAMFGDEARILASLSHPNIIQVIDYSCSDDVYFMALEYVHGEALSALIARNRERGRTLTPACVAYIGGQVARALHYAHEARDNNGTPLEILHRDVSPHNVLVAYDGAIKLIDFGVAQAAGRAERTGPGTIKGKFCYMAPEQFGEGPVDRRADVFALGVCLWEMVSGKRLFYRDSDATTMRAILESPVPELKELAPETPPELNTLVRRMLARDPKERPSTALEVARRLDAVAQRQLRFDEAALAALMADSFAAERARKEEMIKVALAPSVDDFLFAERVNAATAWETLDSVHESTSPVTVMQRGGRSTLLDMTPPPVPASRRRWWHLVAGSAAAVVALGCAVLAAPRWRSGSTPPAAVAAPAPGMAPDGVGSTALAPVVVAPVASPPPAAPVAPAAPAVLAVPAPAPSEDLQASPTASASGAAPTSANPSAARAAKPPSTRGGDTRDGRKDAVEARRAKQTPAPPRAKATKAKPTRARAGATTPATTTTPPVVTPAKATAPVRPAAPAAGPAKLIPRAPKLPAPPRRNNVNL